MKRSTVSAVLGACLLGALTLDGSAASLPGVGSWETRLHPRDLTGDGIADAYFDNVRGITWLADANYAKTSGYVDNPTNFSGWHLTDGRMTPAESTAWVTQLNIGGVTGWRLPQGMYPDPSCISTYASGLPGHDCTGGELGDMYYNILGNHYVGSTLWYGSGFVNSGPFSNIQSDLYWTSTDAPIAGRKIVFAFFDGLSNGVTAAAGIDNHRYAWAVHNGDVGVSTVPLPATTWLFGSGLLALAGRIRRRMG